ncbi:MAG TPA: MFS transporter [Ktedonobacteraceae bacterium]|nr:MFS transporter [Ktedonobacteraceae bacterium]
MSTRIVANRRLLLPTLSLAHISVGILNTLPGASLPQLAHNTQIDLTVAGEMFTASSSGFLLGALLAGILSKQMKPKLMLLLGLALLAAGSLATPLSPAFTLLLGGQFLKGLGIGFINIGLNTILTLSFQETLSEKLNIIHGMYGLGALLGPLLLAGGLQFLGSLTFAYLLGTLASVGTIALLFCLNLPAAPRPVPAQRSSQAASAAELRKVLGQGLLWMMALQIGLYASAEIGFGNWIVTIVSKGAGISLGLAAPVATTFYLGLTIGRLGGSQLLKHARISEMRLLYSALFGGTLIGLLVACFPGQLLVSYVGSALIGCCYGPLFPSIMAMVSRRFVHIIGPVSSLMMVSNGLTTMVVPMGMGLLLPWLGINWVIAIPALLCLAMFVPLVLADHWQRTTLQSPARQHTITVAAKTTGVL